ncbi:MAG: recombinase family protein [Cyanobacteria bacterium P01_C01_bin.72]
MQIFAYLYSDPLLETAPEKNIWGLEVDRIYQDIGEYQQLEQLITDCQSQAPNYLLIRRLEELGDSVSQICDRLNDLESLGIEIITTEQDYGSPEWNKAAPEKLKLNLSNLLQEIQNNKQRSRLQQGHARNRLKMLPPPGKAPYGYRRGQDRYIIDKSTAPVVKDFFERFILFGSLRGAVRYLEKRYGKKISPTTGRNWLVNPVYRGGLKYKNQTVISHTHTAIINPEEAAQIDRLLRRNRPLSSRTASAPRSLAGIVVCQQCQLSMNISRVTQHQKKTEYLYLRCQKCPQQPKCKAIAYQEILSETIEYICLKLPQAVAQLELDDNPTIENNYRQEIARKQELLCQLPELLTQGILDQETVNLRTYKLRQEVALLEAKIAQLPPSNLKAIAQAVSLRQFWLDLSEAERRFYFREFIKQIEIIRDEHDQNCWSIQLQFIF